VSAGDANSGGEPVRLVRIIARLNIGGPAIQAITLTSELDSLGYSTTLVRGSEEPDDGDMDHLADELGVEPVRIGSLRRNPGLHDLRALAQLVWLLRRERPQIVHTHAAKGGTLGRLATLIAFPSRRSRPVLIHTFHGHSLSGYFSASTARAYRAIEQALARRTDRLIAVSDEVRDELVQLRVAPAGKFSVVALGFDLSPFTLDGERRQLARTTLREKLGIAPDATVLTLVARLVPIKRVDRFLRVAGALRDLEHVRFLIVGDGELRDHLQASGEARALGDRVVWAGFRRDMPAVYFASDVVILTSDNEGTPVSLIEAQAAGVPVVSTWVGGTESAILSSAGVLAASSDEAGLARLTRRLIVGGELDPDARDAVRAAVLERFGQSRLTAELDRLYRRELER